jgi:NADH dehydrogenase
MAAIGRKRAIAQIGRLKLSGFPAWILWSFVHIYFLIGFRNRLFVAASWLWNYLTFQRGTRLITGISGARIGTTDLGSEMPATAARILPASAGDPDRASGT